MDGHRHVTRGFLSGIALFLVIMAFFPCFARAQAALCATVKLEIRQELTLERQAFDAHMRITNGLTHTTLTDVGVVVRFTDAEGAVVKASSNPDDADPDVRFFIRVDTLDNIQNVDGSGVVQPSTVADIHWLIIPLRNAAAGIPQGKLYYTGATLNYKIGGEDYSVEVTPDHIFVKPLPVLVLDYFIPEDVFGDDPFTSAIEPVVPFSLGLRLQNTGAGTARNMKIESAQPKILSNDLGLLIGFNIEACEVNGAPAEETLLADFGDLEPGTATTARWIMTCSLSGQFTEFTAYYTHSNELGGQLTSLIEEINTRFLVRDVLVDVPGRDSARDFLALDGGVLRVFESEGIDTEVTDQSDLSVLSGSGVDYTWSVPVTGGFVFARKSDPRSGQKVLKEVLRSDGKRIRPENAWLSKTRKDQGWDYWINLFDANTPGQYTVVFEEPPVSQEPVLQFIPDRTVQEGTRISFLVEATGPGTAVPTLTAAPLPALATFTDQGDGSGIFDWVPASGQAGVYTIVYTAALGPHQAVRQAVITVIGANDSDEDGIDDEWELNHFGNLDRDGTGDYDNDGISDLDEFLNSTDPVQPDLVPGMPVILSPAKGGKTESTQPGLVVRNSIHPAAGSVFYTFELYSDREMTGYVTGISDLEADPGETTQWQVPVPLNDNTRYYWRVRATEGNNHTLWTYGSFFVNTADDPPGAFYLSRPLDGRQVGLRTPVLEVTNSRDPDKDPLVYVFEVYEDAAASVLKATSGPVPQGPDGFTAWTVDAALEENQTYFWKALAMAPYGAVTETGIGSFTVNTAAIAPDSPVPVSPDPGAHVTMTSQDLLVSHGPAPAGGQLTCLFELDRVSTFDSPAKQVSSQLAAGPQTTSWHVDGLEDRTWYYWRARVSDGAVDSPWARGRFFVNTAGGPPPAPLPKNPGTGAWTRALIPEIAVNPLPCANPEQLSFQYEIYRDSELNDLVEEGQSSGTSWSPAVPLEDVRRYYWRARAVDDNPEAGPWSQAVPFFVKTPSGFDPPGISLMTPDRDILNAGTFLKVAWEACDPAGDARISLYYDTDGQGWDGTLIAEDILPQENGTGSFEWDLSGLPDGTYHVYGVIGSQAGNTSDYAPGRVSIDRVPPLVTAHPGSGVYNGPVNVVLVPDEEAVIHYTLDGSEPDPDSPKYEQPIPIHETTALKYLAVDRAGNMSGATGLSYEVRQDFRIRVLTDSGLGLSGVRVYLFTLSGAYTGASAVTSENGEVFFNPLDFGPGEYKVRANYLKSHFWSDGFSFLETGGVDVVIQEAEVHIQVDMAEGPAIGVKVYLFSGDGVYLGLRGTTDENGTVIFRVPVDLEVRFRADVMGSQYWSDTQFITGGQIHHVPVSTGGGSLQVRVEKDQDSPIQGIRVYLFNEQGNYIGRYETTDEAGLTVFDVSQGSYRARADYLGYRFWSDDVLVQEDVAVNLAIPHQSVAMEIREAFWEEVSPIQGIRVHLFNEAGNYVSRYETTDVNGLVTFDLPQQPYLVRASYLRQHYWSEPFVWEDVSVDIPMADAQITVIGAGVPRPGVRVYAFTADGSYVGVHGVTDDEGNVVLRLCEGEYQFRADYLKESYWSSEIALVKNQAHPVSISTGGGLFEVLAADELDQPLAGVKTFVFNESGSYTGLQGVTDTSGKADFDLPDGTFRFRVDYLGSQFWSDPVSVPENSTARIVIEHGSMEVTAGTPAAPWPDVKVFAFSGSGSYLGLASRTDQDGRVLFRLPVGESFCFRADILGHSYWSETHTITAGSLNLADIRPGGGFFSVTVQKAENQPMEGLRALLFTDSGAYQGLSDFTDGEGLVTFRVPKGGYRIRFDYLGYSFWSPETLVEEDTAVTMAIPHEETTVRVWAAFQDEQTSVAGARVHVFTEDGAYARLVEVTGEDGRAVFSLPQQSYCFRVDYLQQQFWSEPVTGQDVSVDLPMAGAQITVTGSGLPQEGIRVYAFTGAGSYLGIAAGTDEEGCVSFLLPEGVYRFRADYQNDQFWSEDAALAADQVHPVRVSAGGGSFDLNITRDSGLPVQGVKCHVFNESGSYIGVNDVTGSDGRVSFSLSDGSYRFRMDYLGYRYWSDTVQVPQNLS